MKKHRRSNRPLSMPGGYNKPPILFENMLLNVLEKSKRLGRQAVPLACRAMERVEIPHRFGTPAELDLQARSLRLSNATTHGTVASVEHRFLAATEIDDMAVKGERWRRTRPIVSVASAFKIFPATLLSALHRCLVELRSIKSILLERATKI